MENISTEVKELNIFQKLRLKYTRGQLIKGKLSIEDINKLPYYIKSDFNFMNYVTASGIFSENELRELDPKLVASHKTDLDFIKGYPIQTIYEIFKEGIIEPRRYSENDRVALLIQMMDAGFTSARKEIQGWGYEPNFDAKTYDILIKSNKVDEANSLLKYCHPQFIMDALRQNPDNMQFIPDNEQEKYKKQLSQWIERLQPEERENYMSNMPQAFEYLSDEKKHQTLRQWFEEEKFDVWKYVSNSPTDEKIFKEEIKNLMIVANDAYGTEKEQEKLKKMIPYIPETILEQIMDKKNGDIIISSETTICNRIILNNMTEKQLADFLDANKSIIKKLKSISWFERDVVSILAKYEKFGCVTYVDPEDKSKFIHAFKLLDKERQKGVAHDDVYYFKYIDPNEQAKYVEDRGLKIFKNCSIEGKKVYIKMHPEDFDKLDNQSKIELVAEDIRLYEFLSEDLKRYINDNLGDQTCAKIFAKRLKENNKHSKELEFNWKNNGGDIKEIIKELFKDVKGIDEQTIIKYILHSKVFSAIGKLNSASDIIHSGGSECLFGIESYVIEQIELIQSLNESTVLKLVKIDANYILPYLTGRKGTLAVGYTELTENERADSELRAKETFSSMYGKEKYEEFSECFKTIFDLEEKYSNEYKISSSSKRKRS